MKCGGMSGGGRRSTQSQLTRLVRPSSVEPSSTATTASQVVVSATAGAPQSSISDSKLPPKLPTMSGAILATCPVIRPRPCRLMATKDTTNIPPTSPNALYSSIRPVQVRPGLCSDSPVSAASASTIASRRAPHSGTQSLRIYDSIDHARNEQQYISPSVLVDDYASTRRRSQQRTDHRRAVTSCDVASRRGPAHAHQLSRHDSLKNVWPGSAAAAGSVAAGLSRAGGSVTNLAQLGSSASATERLSRHNQQYDWNSAGGHNMTSQWGAVRRVGADSSVSVRRACSATLRPTSVVSTGDCSSATVSSGIVPSSSSSLERRNSSSGTVEPGTPSPSDSGVVELGSVLRERDSEINFLRGTMEQNEQVIFKVHEEKEKTWERELRKVKATYDNRLKAAQQKSTKMEQMLSSQTYQLEQDKRKLRAEFEAAASERDQLRERCSRLDCEMSQLKTQLEETEWSLCQKTGEISLLKCQLKDSRGDRTTRGHEVLHVRAQLREFAAQLQQSRAENSQLRTTLHQQHASADKAVDNDDSSCSADQLRKQLAAINEQLRQSRQNFEQERQLWMTEKQKVVAYQKQLQLNFMDMYKRNQLLESQLASRDSKLNSSGESHG